jgi:hypothetical protein
LFTGNKKYESEPPVITFAKPPDSVLPPFTFDDHDYNHYRSPLWPISLIVGLVLTVLLCVVLSIFSQWRWSSTPQPPPVVLPPVPMIEVQRTTTDNTSLKELEEEEEEGLLVLGSSFLSV